jgi:acetoin utilization protein AcuB
MLIANLMTCEPATVSSHDNLEKAATLMKRGGFRRLPVMDGDALVGIVTDRDIRGHAGYLDATTVAAVMTADPQTMRPNMTVEDAARLMIKHKIGGLPVLEDGKLVGIVTTTDVMKAFLQVEAGLESLADD